MKALVGDGVAAFPPRIEWLQAWGTIFRCSGTFANYLGCAKVGCLLANEDTRVFQHPAVRRAKDGVGKSGRSASGEKLWIRRHRIEALMRWAEVCTFGRGAVKNLYSELPCQDNPAAKRFAVLYLVCYIFLLRLPSEALPMVAPGGSAEEDQQSVICLNVVEQELVLKLRRCVVHLV